MERPKYLIVGVEKQKHSKKSSGCQAEGGMLIRTCCALWKTNLVGKTKGETSQQNGGSV